MTAYYATRLSAERLALCYELAPPRMQRYLEHEIQHLLLRVQPGDEVLELGCGTGRVTLRLAEHGLVGPLDRAACRDGVIACGDGFRSARATSMQLRALGAAVGAEPEIAEVDASSLWCELGKPATSGPSLPTRAAGASSLPRSLPP